MKNRFKITFQVVTEASAQHGDFARHGYLPRSGQVPDRTYMPKTPARFTLRQAFDLLTDLPGQQGPIEADSCPVYCPRWLTATGNERESYTQGPGDSVALSLHLGGISAASGYRIARLFKCYGLKLSESAA